MDIRAELRRLGYARSVLHSPAGVVIVSASNRDGKVKVERRDGDEEQAHRDLWEAIHTPDTMPPIAKAGTQGTVLSAISAGAGIRDTEASP